MEPPRTPGAMPVMSAKKLQRLAKVSNYLIVGGLASPGYRRGYSKTISTRLFWALPSRL